MNARLGHYQLLWHAALAQAHGRANAILLWSAGGLTVASVTIIAMGLGLRDAVGMALCIPAGFALFAWTMLFVPGALGLNTPANAQLVPGMRARLMELAALVWVGAMGLLAAGLFVLDAKPAATLIFAIATTLGVAGGVHGVRGAGILLALLFVDALAGKYASQWLLDTLYSPQMALLIVAALVPLGMLAARALFPRGGRRHWAMVAHRASLSGGWGKDARHWDLGAYSWGSLMLRRDVARGRPMKLLLLVLGPDLTVVTLSGATGALIGWGAMSLAVGKGGLAGMREMLASIGWVVTSGILLAFLFQAGAVSSWLKRSRGEQALVRLAPAMPAAPRDFNRLLAHGLLRQSLAIWSVTSAAALFMAYAGGARGTTLVWQACACCTTLPALALVLRDHARASSWSAGFMWVFAVGLSCVGPLAGATGFMLLGLPFGPCVAVAAIALAGFLIRRRLRLMEAAPFAFPAGRLD